MKRAQETKLTEEHAGYDAAPMSWQVVHNPLKVLSSIVVLLIISGYWTWSLMRAKDGLVFLPMDSGELLQGFPSTSDPSHEAMVFWCEGCDISTNPDFNRYRKAVERVMEGLVTQNPHCGDLEWSSSSKPMPGVPASMYVSKDRSTAFVEIHAASMRCMLAVRAQLKQFRRSSGSVLMAPGGPETVADASMAAEFKTALRHSIFAAPVCGFILWMVVGNAFKAGTPMLCVGASYLTGKALVGFFKSLYPTLNVNYDDSCVLFIVLALCVDYALFFWSRFNDELALRCGQEGAYVAALQASLHRSGVVILISNCFVTLAYGCTMLLPYLNLWAYLGLYLQAMGGCVMAGVYSVVLTPALAAALPNVFNRDQDPSALMQQAVWSFLPAPQSIWKAWARTITRGPLMFVIPLVAYGCMLPFVCLMWRYQPSFDVEVQGSRHDIIEQRALAQFEGHFNLGILYPITFVLEAHALGPVDSSRAAGASDIASMLQTVLTTRTARAGLAAQHSLEGSNEANGTIDFEKLLGSKEANSTWHFDKLRVPELLGLKGAERLPLGKAGNVALAPEFGEVACRLAEQLMRETRGKDCEIKADDILALWWMPPPSLLPAGQPGAHGCALRYPAVRLASKLQHVRDPMSHLPALVRKQMPSGLLDSLSFDGKKLLFKVMPAFRPSSPEAYNMDKIIREKILPEQRTFAAGGQRYSLKVQHTSTMQIQVDACHGLGQAVPKVLGIFAPLAAVAIGASFNSAFLAFKLALTVIVPIVTTYGMAIAVYQLGWLDFLGLEMLRQSGGLDFRLMVLTAGILFGFAMDYDLFLFVRVYERRLEGYNNVSAVKRALVETGPVITTAGTMMVVSFYFIMCSHTIFLRTMGFIFTVGVLFDVYVVRTMIAPVFLSIAENLNYWPGKMPPATKSWD